MRALQNLQRQVQSLITRAVIGSVNAATKCQTVDVSLIASEEKTGVEHLEPYGFTSRADAGSEAVLLFPDADRSHAVAIVVADRRYRLKGLANKEVAIFDDQGLVIKLSRDGIVVDGGGKAITFINAPKARFEMDVEATGQIKDLCDSNGLTMAAMRVAYNGHRHKENGQGNNTDTPTTPMGA
ncbi:phage baseplate assembly protein V [Kosakonia pseudosacchari]|uniref:Baseplate assembly protein n=1 Tax=Kosakonia pseudosacchari TaxID=1646340 RepID=A0ABX4IJJ4_9ENTR|nr:phage baseplate assembly protein V [Kosakonia pseudosacchari]PDO83348.1 baseplate assembly protein [Kosakonia pseudosacchari]